jgi:hypothetical protein
VLVAATCGSTLIKITSTIENATVQKEAFITVLRKLPIQQPLYCPKTLRSSLCHRVDNLHSFVLGRESKFRMFRLEVFVEMILGSISIESLSQTDERTYPTREQTVAMALRNERTLIISVHVRVRMSLKTSHVRIRTTTLDMRTLQCAIIPCDRNGDRTAVLSEQGGHYLPHLLLGWSIDPRVPQFGHLL